MANEINSNADMIDVRDVIERFEELRDELLEAGATTDLDSDLILSADATTDVSETQEEHDSLKSLLEDLQGNGGDHQWEGSWYPVTLIADSHFEDYARELAEDIGAISRDDSWPHNFIDWERAAHALQQDYSSVTWNGNEFWYR